MIAAGVAAATVALALAEGGTTPVGYSIAALASWALILVGVAAGLLPRSRPERPAIVVGLALSVLAAITGLSAIWASDPGSAFEEAIVALAYAGTFTLVVLATAQGEARAWLCGLAIGLAAVCVLALGARLEPSLFGDGERELIEALPAAEGRLADPFPYWNALAATLAAGLALVAWLAADARGRVSRGVAAGFLPAFVLALYMTTSRGGIAAAALGLLVLVVAGPRRVRLGAVLAVGLGVGGALIAFASSKPELLDHPLTDAARDQAGSLAAALVAAMLVSGGVVHLLGPRLERLREPRVRLSRRDAAALGAVALVVDAAATVAIDPAERWREFKEPPAPSATGEARDLFERGGSSGRYQFWSAAVDAFREAPLEGVGAAGYEYWWNEHGELSAPGPNGHSLLFDTAAELGALGLAAVLTFLGAALVGGVRRLRRRGGDPTAAGAAFAVLVAGVALAAVDWTWEVPAAFVPVILAVALLAGPACATPGEPVSYASGERPGRRRFVAGLAVLGFAWIAMCGAALLLLTSVSLNASRGSFERGDLGDAARSAKDAIDLEPWAAGPRQQLALVREAEGDLGAARTEIEAAIERSKEDWRLRLIAARIALRAGNEDLARSDAERAKRLAPRLEPLARPVEEILDGLL